MHFFGGGFVAGNLDTDADKGAAYSSIVGAVVVQVNYRKAPEHPYPAQGLLGSHSMGSVHRWQALSNLQSLRSSDPL
ncbi:hypothetical protein WJX73_003831 [Symbiochloris irregularis]|uniref:Alpha/beta hydrolase fold-3 domain-containing protein n=1 Tax=Symbiochloris irregularis TaxID=706552 RepID=A0AAW1PAL1_9CHLO